MGPDPRPGPWCQVGRAVCVEGGWRGAAAAGGSGHVGSDHGGGEGTRLPAGGSDLVTTCWSLVTQRSVVHYDINITSWMASPEGNL